MAASAFATSSTDDHKTDDPHRWRSAGSGWRWRHLPTASRNGLNGRLRGIRRSDAGESFSASWHLGARDHSPRNARRERAQHPAVALSHRREPDRNPPRPRSVTGQFVPTPWRGRFSDYRLHDDRWLPFAAEIGWEIAGQEIVYWQGRMNQWELFPPSPTEGSRRKCSSKNSR